jgi:hypothetical protein
MKQLWKVEYEPGFSNSVDWLEEETIEDVIMKVKEKTTRLQDIVKIEKISGREILR